MKCRDWKERTVWAGSAGLQMAIWEAVGFRISSSWCQLLSYYLAAPHRPSICSFVIPPWRSANPVRALPAAPCQVLPLEGDRGKRQSWRRKEGLVSSYVSFCLIRASCTLRGPRMITSVTLLHTAAPGMGISRDIAKNHLLPGLPGFPQQHLKLVCCFLNTHHCACLSHSSTNQPVLWKMPEFQPHRAIP